MAGGDDEVGRMGAAGGKAEGGGVATGSGALGPLTAEQLRMIQEARRRARRVRGATSFARFSGGTMAFFALVTFALAMGDRGWELAASVGCGVVLSGLAFNELKGAELLSRLDARGARRLAIGQVVLGVAIVAYAVWKYFEQVHSSPLASLGGTTGDAKIDRMVLELTGQIAPLVWGGVGVGGLLVSLLTARCYWARGKMIGRMRREMPWWVMEVVGEGR